MEKNEKENGSDDSKSEQPITVQQNEVNYNGVIVAGVILVVFFIGILLESIPKIAIDFTEYDTDAAIFRIVSLFGYLLMGLGVIWVLIAKVNGKKQKMIEERIASGNAGDLGSTINKFDKLL